ncbi:MAG: hypothetical protein ACP5R6_04090 [Chlorobaculum sp.]
MPETRKIQKRECYYDHAGRKRWKTVTYTETVYSAEERAAQRAHLKRFFLSFRFICLPFAAILYLIITINLHRTAIDDYEQWLASERAYYPVVYVTLAGKAYHTSSHYSARSIPISLFDAIRVGRRPCRVCQPVTATLTPEQRNRRAPEYFGYGAVLVLMSLIYYSVAFATFPTDSKDSEQSSKLKKMQNEPKKAQN